jgi:hypothetical protein
MHTAIPDDLGEDLRGCAEDLLRIESNLLAKPFENLGATVVVHQIGDVLPEDQLERIGDGRRLRRSVDGFQAGDEIREGQPWDGSSEWCRSRASMRLASSTSSTASCRFALASSKVEP